MTNKTKNTLSSLSNGTPFANLQGERFGALYHPSVVAYDSHNQICAVGSHQGGVIRLFALSDVLFWPAIESSNLLSVS